jgi:hypothetical protein
MVFRKANVWMGGNKINDETTEFVAKHASEDRLRAVLAALRSFG